MAEKKIVSPFKNLRHCEGQKDFDQYWISYVPYDVVKKTGEGEEDFTIVTKFKEKKVNISCALREESKNVTNIDELVHNYNLTGDSSILPTPWVGQAGAVRDLTGAPSDLADALMAVDAGKQAYNSLDPELKNGRSLEDFASSVTDQEAIEFIKSYLSKKYAKKQKIDEAGKDKK